MKLTILYLLSISLAMVNLSCASSSLNLLKLYEVNSSAVKIPVPKRFSKKLLRVNMEIYGHYLSGLLLIKKLAKDGYRAVFMTETGIKLFDLALVPKTFTVHFCIQELNKKFIIQAIAQDLRLLLVDIAPKQKITVLRDEENLFTVYRICETTCLDYYIGNANGLLVKLENRTPWAKKVTVVFNNYRNFVAQDIAIIHYDIDVRIFMHTLETK